MRSVVKIASLAFMVLAALPAVGDGEASYLGEVLWWMVGDNTDDNGVLSGITIKDFDGTTIAPNADGTYTVRDTNINAARVRVLGEGLDSAVYLTLIKAENGTVQPLRPPDAGFVPDYFFAAVGDYASEAYSFQLELGNYNNGNWVAVAVSEIASYDSLGENGSRNITEWSTGEHPSPTGGAWAPTAYTVPEPSGGLLLFIGGCLLALRRRRKGCI